MGIIHLGNQLRRRNSKEQVRQLIMYVLIVYEDDFSHLLFSIHTGYRYREYVYRFGELPTKTYGCCLKRDQALHIMDWIKRKCRLGWKPGVIKCQVVGNETYDIPKLTRTDKAWNSGRPLLKNTLHVPKKSSSTLCMRSSQVQQQTTGTKTRQRMTKKKNSEPPQSTTCAAVAANCNEVEDLEIGWKPGW
jgi:hypothetical protein